MRSEKTAVKTVILAIFGAVLGVRSHCLVGVLDSFGRGAIGVSKDLVLG